MKTFVVFLALMLLNVSFLSFHTDMDRYQKLQVYLKAAAEEAAAGGALCRDEEAFGSGLLAVREDDARRYAAFIIEGAEKELQESIGGSAEWKVEIFDDEKGYGGCEKYGLTQGLPAVLVSVNIKCRDLFRLPFLSVTSVKRSAVYQWENRLGWLGNSGGK